MKNKLEEWISNPEDRVIESNQAEQQKAKTDNRLGISITSPRVTTIEF